MTSEDPEYIIRRKIRDKFDITMPNSMTREELLIWYDKESLKPKVIPENKINPTFSNPIPIIVEEQVRTPMIGKSIRHNYSEDVYVDSPLPLEGNLETLQAMITDLKINNNQSNKFAVFQLFRPRIRSSKLKQDLENSSIKTKSNNSMENRLSSRFVIVDEDVENKYTVDELTKMKLTELKEIAKNNGIKAPKTKAELLEILISKLTVGLKSAPVIETEKDVFETRINSGREDEFPNSPVLTEEDTSKMLLPATKISIPKYSTAMSPLSLPNSIVTNEKFAMSSKLNDYKDIDMSKLNVERNSATNKSYNITELKSIAKRLQLRSNADKRQLVNDIRTKLEELSFANE